MKKISIEKINEIREKRSLWEWTKIAIIIWLIWHLGIYILIGTGAMIAVPIMLIMDQQEKKEMETESSGIIRDGSKRIIRDGNEYRYEKSKN